MSVVQLAEVKAYLNVLHSGDDGKLQVLIEAAEDEALQFLDRDTLPLPGDAAVDEADSNQPAAPVGPDDLAAVVRIAIYLLVQALYDGADAAEMAATRRIVEGKLMPYRNRLGV